MTICDQCESKDGRATFCKTILDLEYDLCMECIEYVKTELEGLKGGRSRTGPIHPIWVGEPLPKPFWSYPQTWKSIPCGTSNPADVTVRGTPYEFETTTGGSIAIRKVGPPCSCSDECRKYYNLPNG